MFVIRNVRKALTLNMPMIFTSIYATMPPCFLCTFTKRVSVFENK